MKQFAGRLLSLLHDLIKPNLVTFLSERHPVTWLAALLVGLLAAFGSAAFRLAINAVQLPWLGTMSERVASAARAVPWPMVMLAPVAGGLIVGLIVMFISGRRAGGPADVIEAAALGHHRLTLRNGLLGALASAVTLGSGGSAGREGPVVYLGGTLAAAFAQRLRLSNREGRTLLGAGVAAAIAASFNAPIAGALFALEVILRRMSATALPPIVIASAVGAVVGRAIFGDYPAFAMPEYHIASAWEFPAFALLGVLAAAVAIFFQLSVMGADWALRNLTVPLALKPALGGLFVGVLGVFFPEVLGVGYDTMELALSQQLSFGLLVGLVFLKTAATAVTLGSRLAGGIFSPALYLGALAGAAFGIVAVRVVPELASSLTVYAILGMGAVAGAVLGAPISTTIIVFELTGGYAMSVALLLTVSVASALTRGFLGRSFFHLQLASRGLFLDDGPHRRVGRSLVVKGLVRPLGPDETVALDAGHFLKETDTVEAALKAFDASGLERLPVVESRGTQKVVGVLEQADALKAFNAALIEAVAEEHR
jgi:CIC family chloride channel protein